MRISGSARNAWKKRQPTRCQMADRWVPKCGTHFFFPVVLLHYSLLCSRSRTQCFKSCFIYFSGKHSQSFRWSQNGGHSRSSGTLFKTRMEPPISHDEGIWLCLWQFYPRPSIWPAPLAIHLGLQNPAQVYRAQEMSFKIISGHLGK